MSNQTINISRYWLLLVIALVSSLVSVSCTDTSSDPLQGGLPTVVSIDANRSTALGQRSGDAGIVVTGIGVATGEPDIAIIAISVESIAKSVKTARQRAASSMEDILTVLTASGINDNDINTVQFRVDPQYDYEEELSGRTRTTKRILSGFRVINSLSVTLREIEKLGNVIDGSLGAAGDTARIDSISFSVADASDLANKARRLAVNDALEKAKLYSLEAGVYRGKLLHLIETGGQPVPKAMRSMAMGAVEGAGTPFAPGSFKIETKIQATFAID